VDFTDVPCPGKCDFERHDLPWLFLQACKLDALDEGLLREEECNNDRDGKDNRSRHQLVPDHCALTLKIL
jgi:hypothetical protein